jgi:UDP-N-acetylglucosamine--N-acetylmuramyl-(pentapeptide) pyrophosphoryl-undecaprenol N-acetylglucosamine transferase
MSTREIVIAAGGTGGHILPAIQIGRRIEAAHGGELRPSFICGSRAIESRIYTGEGIAPLVLGIGGRGPRLMHMVIDFARMLGRFVAKRPAAVLGMGGAACFPVLAAATGLGIPIFLHESNAVPGRVVRLFRGRARRVYLGLGGLSGQNVEITGTPAKTSLSANVHADVVLCVGGSQGADKLNALFVAAANQIATELPGLRFVLLSGPGKQVPEPGVVEVREYEPNMPALLAQTRIAVSRSGAGALADIANFTIPSILVPYPFAMDDHQLANARIYTNAGAAVCFDEKTLSADLLARAIRDLHRNDDRREQMSAALAPFATGDSAARIVASMIQHISALHGAFQNQTRKVESS